MKLRDFIKDAMTEIAYGIQSAKLETAELWAISPGKLHGEVLVEKSYVDFDVAVTVSEAVTTDKSGKAALKAEIEVFGSKVGGEIGGGAENQKAISTINVSRIVFKVPVYMNAHFRGDEAIAEEAEHFAKIAKK